MDNREIRFYDGTVDCLKSIAKSLERIARYYDRIEAIMDKEEEKTDDEPMKYIVPDDILTCSSLDEADRLRNDIIGRSLDCLPVTIAEIYRMRGMEDRIGIGVYYHIGWGHLSGDDIKISSSIANHTYKLQIIPAVERLS